MSDERKERFTPGPWTVTGSRLSVAAGFVKFMAVGVCSFDNIQDEERSELEANAALVATAPEMYALLSEIDGLPVADVSGPMKDVLACVDFRGRVNAVLKKARGEA